MPMLTRHLPALALGCAAIALSPHARSDGAALLTVCAEPASDCDFSGAGALQSAIDAATDGAEIVLRAGVYQPASTADLSFGDIVVRSAITIDNKQLSLHGEPGTVIRGSSALPATAIGIKDSRVELSNLRIEGFTAAEMEDDIYDGHGVFLIDSNASLEQVDISGLPKMALSIRGASAVKASQLSVRDGHIGVWIEEKAQLKLSASYFSGNDSAGVAAYQQSQVSVVDSVFETNRDDGVYASGEATVSVSGSSFINNSPYALRADESSRISIDRSYLRDNDSDFSPDTTTAGVEAGSAMLTVDPRRDSSRDSVEQRNIRDCEQCPPLVTIPPGQLLRGVEPADDLEQPDQQPRHELTIETPFALGIYPVTRAEFSRFIEATGRQTVAACNALDGVTWVMDEDRNWRDPGYPQQDSHPVVCVSWQDAIAYTRWLSSVSGHNYRLPSEAEWEYAARSGMPEDARINKVNRSRANHGTPECCGPVQAGADVWDYTSPVGSMEVNAFGLYDTQGNVWEWVEDCYNDSYINAPVDGSARTQNCSQPDRRVVRGGSWGDDSYYMTAHYRLLAPKSYGYFTLGFRVARDLRANEQ